ncbi:Heterokaryon incompatibility protein 6- OR allele [Apiospora phragmitis]|uniref:Heterokaryon incompatibility protein 6- OR allele n=1 Tax=Apiospora phragmitis TaxID=2905665 RepID=A0ABR1W701_9PEZI
MSQPEPRNIQDPESPESEAVGPDWEEYDLQIALDQLAGGSTDALKLFLARQEGVDPNTVSLTSTPWRASEDSSLSFIGAVDNIDPPGVDKGVGAKGPRQLRRVALENTGTPYEYSRLNPELRQLRLLRLFSLSDAPAFFCLSYVWGDPSQFLAVNCDGGMVPVTQNLFHALRNCFDRYPESWLWADGICINQQDVAERGSQVQLMGSIYEKASMVLAHPGHYRYGKVNSESESDDHDEPVVDHHVQGTTVDDPQSLGANGPGDSTASTTLTKFPKPAESYGMADFQPIETGDAYSSTNVQSAVSIMTFLSRTWTVGSEDKTLSDTYWDKTSLPDLKTQEGRKRWTNLLEFWSQDWYFRTWVFQEIVLAAKVVVLYEDTAISLDAITEFWSLAGSRSLPRVLRIGPLADIYNRVRHLSPVSSIKSLREKRGKGTNDQERSDAYAQDSLEDGVASGPSLLELLCLSRSNLATDPRDKVFGLLGVTDDAISRSIVPDYSPANTAAKLFIDVASELVLFGHVGDLLHHAGLDQKISDLPSWVPDWTKQSRSTFPAHLYQCMGESTPKCSILDTERAKKPKLRVRGVILAQINTVGAPWKFYSHDPSEPSFGKFKNAPDVEIAPAPLNDEDARNLILSMTDAFEEDIAPRYSEEGFQDAVARTLAADCSWQGGRIGRRSMGASTTSDASQRNQLPNPVAPRATPGDEFFEGLDAFQRFYARGPESEEDLTAPGIRIHQTGLFMWLLDFDKGVEADLQHRMVPFTTPFQETQRGRRFAVLGKPSSDAVGGGGSPPVNDNRDDDETGAEEQLDNHFMGTVPWDAENKDYCVLLEGFRTPFILRKGLQQGQQKPDSSSSVDGSEQEEFELMGDCYVHGIMDGELLYPADKVDEDLGPEFRSVNDAGREYVVRAPQGYVLFRNFVLV